MRDACSAWLLLAAVAAVWAGISFALDGPAPASREARHDVHEEISTASASMAEGLGLRSKC